MSNAKLKKVAAALPGKVRKLANYELFELGRNAKHTVQSMLQTVFEAALNFTSIEVIAGVKESGPSADTIRGHLDWKVSLDDVEKMMMDRVKWLATSIHRKTGRTSFEIAFDWSPEMYYGSKGNPFINGTEPKAGTCWAYEFFTVSIVASGERLLLFAYPLYGRENLLFYINRALLFLRKLRMFPSVVYLDRGFRSVDIFAYLKDERIDFITPAYQDSKFEREVAPVEKFPAVFNGWQMQNADRETVEIDLVVVEDFFEDKDSRVKRRLCGFFTNLPKKFYKGRPEIIAEMYSRRWGIETAHRCEDEFRIKSTSVSGIVRYLYFVVGMLAYNLWVYLNLLFCENAAEFKIIIKKDVIRLLCGRLFGKFRI